MFKVLLLLVSIPLYSLAQILPVEEVTQEQNQWCWAASSLCVLKYYGADKMKQCDIVNFTRLNADWHDYGNEDCCDNPSGPCNYWNYNWGGSSNANGDIEHILYEASDEVSVDVLNIPSSVIKHKVNAAISDYRPIIIRVNDGGHFMVLHGMDNNTLFYMDPWFGEGKQYQEFNTNEVNGREWTHTQICLTNLQTDTFQPSPPSNLKASNITLISVDLSWETSNINDSIKNYHIYENKEYISSTELTFHTVYGLNPKTTYSFTVKALDTAGNLSEPSNEIEATTKGDSIAASVKNFNQARLFKVYPNPADKKIFIDYQGEGSALIKINSIYGSVIKTKRIHKGKQKISITDIPNGIYLINLYKQNILNGVAKLVIQ